MSVPLKFSKLINSKNEKKESSKAKSEEGGKAKACKQKEESIKASQIVC